MDDPTQLLTDAEISAGLEQADGLLYRALLEVQRLRPVVAAARAVAAGEDNLGPLISVVVDLETAERETRHG